MGDTHDYARLKALLAVTCDAWFPSNPLKSTSCAGVPARWQE
jgi:hypothetical protein